MREVVIPYTPFSRDEFIAKHEVVLDSENNLKSLQFCEDPGCACQVLKAEMLGPKEAVK